MLERAGDHAFPYELHGGSVTKMQWHFHGQSELPVAVQTWELPPGGSEGMHVHAEPGRPLEEMYLVVAGSGHMTVDGETFPVAAGDAVLAKVGVQHDVRNTGKEPLRLVVVWGEPRASDYSEFGSATSAAAARSGTAGATVPGTR